MAKTRRNRSSRNKKTKESLPRHAATFHGMHHWSEHLFEKLGWMIIAKAKGYSEKVTQYKHSIKHFLETTDHLMTEYENHNRKHDLNVLRMNMKKLDEFVSKHL